jgi:hypothetical protein
MLRLRASITLVLSVFVVACSSSSGDSGTATDSAVPYDGPYADIQTGRPDSGQSFDDADAMSDNASDSTSDAATETTGDAESDVADAIKDGDAESDADAAD